MVIWAQAHRARQRIFVGEQRAVLIATPRGVPADPDVIWMTAQFR